ncbi:peptide methionine sulfoxide reductase B [Haloferula helveola]|uniref:peptide-methionine (R)-S-oxide reductase n=1 Tax=Haloferula helveola TaxID=490095 RepID=A0ABM7RR85_9BACT|nr:peptide methionine sulfoxide reductase B [Haloferula helveola]
MKSAAISAILALSLAACADESSRKVMETSDKAPEQPAAKIEKTDEEWRKELTPEQYEILRQAGTERANGQVYHEFKKQGAGTYYCAGCDAELFSSNEKFDSGCGWPSFYDPSKAKNVKTSVDYHLGYPRTEVRCAICDGHLGHVFTGEGFDTPTDKRYCINGTVLKFVPAGEPKPDKTPEEAPEKPEPEKPESE